MNAADDVIETQSLFEQLADLLAPREDDKVQVRVLHTELREKRDEPLFTWNRVFELLKGRARRVDAWEKEYAGRRLAALRRQEAIDQIGRLNRTLQYLKTTDPDGYRSHIDSVERSLAMAGVLDRPVAQAAGREGAE